MGRYYLFGKLRVWARGVGKVGASSLDIFCSKRVQSWPWGRVGGVMQKVERGGRNVLLSPDTLVP